MNSLCKGGLILLILGIVFVVVLYPLLSFSSLYSFNFGLAMIAGLLLWISIVFIPIGIVLAIVGAITSPKEHYIYPYNYQHPQYPQNQYIQPLHQQPQNNQIKYCTECGNRLDTNSNFCNECGKKL